MKKIVQNQVEISLLKKIGTKKGEVETKLVSMNKKWRLGQMKKSSIITEP